MFSSDVSARGMVRYMSAQRGRRAGVVGGGRIEERELTCKNL